MKNRHIRTLLKKYLDGKTSAKENYLLDSFIEDQLLSNSWDISAEEKKILGADLKNKIDQKLSVDGSYSLKNKNLSNEKGRKLWPIIAVAAMITIISLTALYFIRIRKQESEAKFTTDIKPGKNQALLTLADGRKINLSTSINGELANVDGISVKKTEHGELVFSIAKSIYSKKPNQRNMLETPLGGQYKVNLADGTQVWLNAGTTLKFPNQFNGSRRTVELDGEAYFEVAKDHAHPFWVKSGSQNIEVLGTHFNINNYRNEPHIKTTLLEGSIKLDNGYIQKLIEPGEQATLTGNAFEVKSVDPALAVDWKNGEFRFKNENLKSIFRKLSRWYDVDFIIENRSTQLPNFTGSVSRFDQISVILKMLEETGNVKFHINGKVITVK